MTDLVKRLRYPMIGDAVYEPQLRLEAAAEIERLRSEARVYQDTMQWEQREKELQAEIERLRAALQEIARADCWTVDNSGIEISHDELCTLSREFNVRANLADPHHYRINEWLKRQISRRILEPRP